MGRILCVPLSYFISTMLLFGTVSEVHALPKCLHVMSYHQGYEWNDGIEAGVESVLRGKCELKKFYMDSKRNTEIKFIQQKALQAKKLIESYKPDIVIASDDNASRYLVQVFYKNVELPFVFAGINWDAEAYGYPYKNATGMVEVAPVQTMLEIAQRNIGRVREIAFLSGDVLTEHKDYEQYARIYGRLGIDVRPIFVKDMRAWLDGFASFAKAQTADFIILGNNAGIRNWDNERALRQVNELGKILTMTTYKWMMPVTMLGVRKRASEQGEWAAEVALEILAGTDVKRIPITINRHWVLYQNKELLVKAGIDVDDVTRRKAIVKNWLHENN
ncbi:MAG: hypothetical protein KAT25_09855 [Sulfuriflexus sp.]|nr:hypothetical protein [Sulfuriflexus sp.]